MIVHEGVVGRLADPLQRVIEACDLVEGFGRSHNRSLFPLWLSLFGVGNSLFARVENLQESISKITSLPADKSPTSQGSEWFPCIVPANRETSAETCSPSTPSTAT